MKKIALLGTAPSSIRLAPFHDRRWTIWSCSPGAMSILSRTDAHFEIHKWEPDKPWFHPDYIKWMASRQCPVYMIEPRPEIPTSVAYPKDDILRYVWGRNQRPDGRVVEMRFDPNAFGSSLSWMLALAITQMPDEIGFWGVDMAANEEYGPQKDGCLNLIQVARNMGIKVTAPPESDLLRPTALYGFREVDPMFVKLETRVAELTEHLQKAEHDYQEANSRRWFFKGALDDATYVRNTWVSDPTQVERIYDTPFRPEPMKAVEHVKEEPARIEVKPGEIQPVIRSGERRKAKRIKANGTAEKAAH